MKKNGFVFVETIVAIVVLTSSLLLLYSSFSKILQAEKTRIYYDDVAFIYRSWHIRNALNNLNINSVLDDLSNNEDNYFVSIGIETDSLFNNHESDRQYITNLLDAYNAEHMIIVKESKFENLKSCILNEGGTCNNLNFLTDEMKNYLKTIFIDVECSNFLVIQYNICNNENTVCKKYFSWVSV